MFASIINGKIIRKTGSRISRFIFSLFGVKIYKKGCDQVCDLSKSRDNFSAFCHYVIYAKQKSVILSL